MKRKFESYFLKCQRGQALVESVIVMFTLSVIVMGSLSTLYFCFAKLWLRHFAHESLICLASQKSPTFCQQDFIKNMHSSLPFGRLMVDELFIFPHSVAVRARWSFGLRDNLSHQSHFRIREHQELALPILKRESFL
jgi:hypothetical protein